MDLRFLKPVRQSLRAVNRPPGREWRDQATHHGFRAAAILVVALLLPVFFPRESLPELDGLELGMLAPRDIVARVPFSVPKSEEQLEAERRNAEGRIAPIFSLDPTAGDSAAENTHAFFLRLGEAVGSIETPEGEDETPDLSPLSDVLGDAGILTPQPQQLALLADSVERELLHRTLETAFRELLPEGVAPSSDLDEVFSRNVIIRGPPTAEGRDALIPRDSVRTVGDFVENALEDSPRGLSATGLQIYQTFLVSFVEPSLRLDADLYRQAREEARSAVETAAGYVLEGEQIVEARRPIGTAELDKLRAYEVKLIEEGLAEPGTGLWRGLGVTLFGLVLLGLFGWLLYLFRMDIYEDVRSFSLLFLLLVLVLGAAGLIAGTGASAALVPVAFAALLVAALFDSVLAVVVIMVIAALLMGQPAFEGVNAPFLTIVAGATAALGIREVRRRSQSWLLIALITGAYTVAGLALLLLGRLEVLGVFQTMLWGGVNATLSTALAMGAALPVAEAFTRRTTSQTLLELADLNRPLLRRLSREAPGTYSHSINVANLAEAASIAIGADALLVRVGTYYHDVGKITRPQYFIENQPLGLNPHDRLTPQQSAEVLRAHVREGLQLADEAKLPDVIRDFIREHHGSQKIGYFLAKAQELEPDADLDINDFCYPGPKPQSRETAVVMLADAVESAARTLRDPSPERIRALIDRLVEVRINEDQLDECLLTLRDLDAVKSEFAHVLTGLYHQRIDYPTGGGPALEAPAAPGSAMEKAFASDTGPAPSLDEDPADRPPSYGRPARQGDAQTPEAEQPSLHPLLGHETRGES
jgi:putative nucleotidyltransferase with HDIG domain